MRRLKKHVYFTFFITMFCSFQQAQAINPQLINDEQLLMLRQYQLDPVYLSEFPFSDYRIVESQQGKFYVDNRDFIKSTLESGRVWEVEIVELIRKYVKPDTIAIDVGAHIGTHSMMMSQCVQKDGTVIAFEPQAKINRELILNTQLNDCENVIPVHSALGEKNGFAYLEPVRQGNEGYRCISSKQKNEKINLMMLDEFQLSSISFIKIDAESYELEVLQGAYETIMNNRPVIVIEIGGGKSREIEENINPKEHLRAVIYMLENDLNYDVTVISSATGDYLAIPR